MIGLIRAQIASNSGWLTNSVLADFSHNAFSTHSLLIPSPACHSTQIKSIDDQWCYGTAPAAICCLRTKETGKRLITATV